MAKKALGSGCDDYTAEKFAERIGLGQAFGLVVKGNLEFFDGRSIAASDELAIRPRPEVCDELFGTVFRRQF